MTSLVRQVILAEALELHPQHLTVGELTLRIISDPDDGMAFSRSGLLMYTRYEIGGLSMATLSQNLTVESLFEHCILDVLGLAKGTE